MVNTELQGIAHRQHRVAEERISAKIRKLEEGRQYAVTGAWKAMLDRRIASLQRQREHNDLLLQSLLNS